ncbi:hypothetical protein NQZ79_g5339 [Umbelopsis isabellina]|nr:hypothetical protein NQZ79_g5339 [Umbelopsis isabellina]
MVQTVPCKYKTGRVLGNGTYATVKEAMHVDTGKYYAVKIINKKLMEGREHMIRNEINVLRRISQNHKNILSLVDYFETLNNLYLVTDLALGGELFDRICQKGSYFERDAAHLVQVVVVAVQYLHENGVVHRDLKPENLLFRTPDEDSDLLIADFGLSRIIDTEKFHVLTTTCGTPGYMAPEIFKKTGHGKPVDMWAIGVITFFLLCGYTPFEHDSNMDEMHAIMNADYSFDEQYWHGVSDNAKDFITKLLTIDPSKRLTAEQALEHPWLQAEVKKEDEGKDLLPNVSKNFNARRTFKKAVDLVRLSQYLGHKHAASMGGGKVRDDSSHQGVQDMDNVKPVQEGLDEVLKTE